MANNILDSLPPSASVKIRSSYFTFIEIFLIISYLILSGYVTYLISLDEGSQIDLDRFVSESIFFIIFLGAFWVYPLIKYIWKWREVSLKFDGKGNEDWILDFKKRYRTKPLESDQTAFGNILLGLFSVVLGIIYHGSFSFLFLIEGLCCVYLFCLGILHHTYLSLIRKRIREVKNLK